MVDSRDRARSRSLSGLVDEHVALRLALRLATRETARNLRSALKLFVGVVGEGTDPTEISRHDVEQFLVEQGHLSPATRRSRLSAVRTFLGWLLDEGLINADPSAAVPAPRQPRSIPRALPAAAVAAVLAACPDSRAFAIVWLMVGLGLRCCEVANLEVGDWDPAKGTLFVTGKSGHQRMLPVEPEEVGHALRAYLAEWPATAGPMFRSYRKHRAGLVADTISGLVGGIMVDAGIKTRNRDGVSAHALRHTAASDVLDRCHDLRIVQAMLGHANLQTTAIYLRAAAPEEMRAAMGGRSYVVGG